MVPFTTFEVSCSFNIPYLWLPRFSLTLLDYEDFHEKCSGLQAFPCMDDKINMGVTSHMKTCRENSFIQKRRELIDIDYF